MVNTVTNYPIFDLHCDLLSYLASVKGADPHNSNDIGCAIPFLKEGNVKFQVLAVWTATHRRSAEFAQRQVVLFKQLCEKENECFLPVTDRHQIDTLKQSKQTGVVLSIENASGLCEEDEKLDIAFDRLDQMIQTAGRVFYISLTHFGENRFGGGNASTAGLKRDGEALLSYIHGKKIAIDLSHTSDALACDILDFINKKNLDIPIIASHSNFRGVYHHARNLPDEIAREIIRRKGLIGINFVRAFVHPDNPEKLNNHILYGFGLGGENTICFGADFFYTKNHPDKNRLPFFFKEHENSGKYQEILHSLQASMTVDRLIQLSHRNAMDFIHRIWDEK